MNTSLDVAIRDWLARYLAGEIDLRAFQEWFVPTSWNQTGQGDARLDELIGEIELRLAELSSGHRTETELRRFLVPLVTNYRSGGFGYETTSSATTTEQVVRMDPGSVGTVRSIVTVSS